MEGMLEEKAALTVSALNQKIKGALETERFSKIRVRGEISNFVAHSSGHWYFSLKDEESQLKAVMFRGDNSQAGFLPENGGEAIAEGRVSVYSPRGVYQLICSKLFEAGRGALQLEFERIKERLRKEGLFDSDRKRPIPPFPRHIGLITSPTAAALQDILNVLSRRASGLRVTVIPALVQGAAAPESLRKALELAQAARFLDTLDTLIIGRGGGSAEDLHAFNDEALARAIAASRIPIISAVGHEIDFTISDFAADLRAATPSAAAELVAKSGEETLERLARLRQSLLQNIRFQLDFLKERAGSLEKRLAGPESLIQQLSQKRDELTERLRLLMTQKLQAAAREASSLKKLLSSLNPRQVMERGFSIVRGRDGQIVKSSGQLKPEEKIRLEFCKGEASAIVEETSP